MNEIHWDIEQYLEFVSERRTLLADAANKFLDFLYNSTAVGNIEIAEHIAEEATLSEEDELVLELALWMEEKGLDSGEFNYEVTSEEGKESAVFDLAWPQGIQVGLSKPVTFLVDQPEHVFEIANLTGYTYFTEVEDFKMHVEKNYL